MADAYTFRIAGQVSRELLNTFDPSYVVEDDDGIAFVRAVRDQSELFGVIARCETLGLRLVGFGPAQRSKPDGTDGAERFG